jgi:hypothetical protein
MEDESATVGQRQVVADQIEVVGIDGALLLEEGSLCRLEKRKPFGQRK